jgi:hypothetical protein
MTRQIHILIFFWLFIGALANGCDIFAGGQKEAVGTPPPRYHRLQTLVKNSGFELGQAYWKDLASEIIGAKISADSSVACDGQRALKIDLQSAKRLSNDGDFMLASPWLTLQGGGYFSFSIYMKSNRHREKVSLRLFNSVSNEGLRSGKQLQQPMSKEFACSESWSRLTLEGQLPAAEKDNYRFVVQLAAPVVYWLDKVEILHNNRLLTFVPEIEAVLQPLSTSRKLCKTPGLTHALLRVVNHTNRQRRLRFVARQSATLNRFESSIDEQLVLEPKQSLLEQVKFDLPFADVYHIGWQVLDENSKPVQDGQLRLAAINSELPRAAGGEPVWGMHLNDNNLDASLPILRDSGIQLLRNLVNLHWDSLEPKPGQWQWPDSLLRYLQSQGFAVLGKLAYTPKWAIDPAKAKGWPLQNKMPVSMESYRQYVHSVVSRYAQQINHWEIWNEPNLARFFDGTPQDYASLLASAVAEIKSWQPQAHIAGYALAKCYDPATLDFIQTVINNQPALRLDAVSFHPYADMAPEEAGLPEKINQFRALFKKRQDDEPQFWITELGYQGKDTINTAIAYQPPLRRQPVNELTQAAYLARAAYLSKMAGVKYFFGYAMDSERVKRGPDIYGLLDEEWTASPKPALLAYLTVASLLGDAAFDRRVELSDPEVYLLQFRHSDGKNVSVLWATKEEKRVKLPTSLLHSVSYDIFGNRLNRPVDAMTTAGPLPIYFVY